MELLPIVSRLRPRGGNEIDPKKLPVLSEEEKASLNCLKPGFIQKLINLADTPRGEIPNEATNTVPEKPLT